MSITNEPGCSVEQLLESFPCPVVLVRRTGDIAGANTAFASIVTMSPAECRGKAFHSLEEATCPGAHTGRTVNDCIRHVFESGTQSIADREIFGSVRRVTLNPVRSSEGEIEQVLVLMECISETDIQQGELEKENALKTALLDAMPGCAAILDEHGELVLWNHYARGLVLGADDGDAPHRKVTAEDFFPRTGTFHEILLSDTEHSGEICMRPAGDTGERWLATRGKRVCINGRVCVVAVGVDISEKKAVEEELTRNRVRFGQALEAAQAGVWEWELGCGSMIWSDEMWGLYGLKKCSRQPSVSLWEELMPLSGRNTVLCSMQEAVSHGRKLDIEYSISLPDGSERWILSRGMPMYDEEGVPRRYIGTSMDISERKQLEERLRESKVRFSYALDAAHSGIWEWNVENDRLSWSEQVWGLYGLEPHSRELNHELCVMTVHPEDREMVSGMIRSAVRSETSASVEYRVSYPDGSIHWLRSMGMPLKNRHGQVVRYIGTITDITDRKQTELELRESKARLGQALEAARAGVWEWDLETGENIWSDEIWSLYGLEKASAPPSFELWVQTIIPDDRQMAIDAVTSAAKNQKYLNVEYRVRYSDGSIHWLMSRGRPQMDSGGRVERYIGTIIDITERKQMEQELTDRKARFRFALEATNAGVWEWDLNTDSVIWSDRIWALYGLEPDSLPHDHKLCQSTVHPDDKDKTFEIVMAAASKEEEINIEYRVCHPDGSVHWLACRGMPQADEKEGMTRYIGTVMDISARKHIETALKENELKFRSVYDHAPLAISIEDIETGRLVDVNAAWLNLFGYCKEEILGKSSVDLRLYAEMSDYDSVTYSVRKRQRVVNKPLLLCDRTGGFLNVLYSSEFISLKNQPVLLSMMTDVTVQKLQQKNIDQLEQAVAERTKQLQEEIERLQRFLSMISHEYRTPLAIIRTNLDLIRMKNKMGNFSNKEELFKINRAINRLVEVLEVSIEESRISKSSKSSSMNVFRIAPVITSQIEEIRNMWPERTISYAYCPDTAEVLGEQSQIKFAIFNLLDNARKYSPPDSVIELECHADAENIMIMIRNEGESVTPQEAESFFEKYHRGKHSANTAGAGLGLWLVRNIIHQHQGEVAIRPTPTGVEAIVILPVASRKI